MASANAVGTTDHFTRASGKKVWDMASGYILPRKLTEIKLNTEDSGRMTNDMGKRDLLCQMRRWFMVILEMINSMALLLMSRRIYHCILLCLRMEWWWYLMMARLIGCFFCMFCFRWLLMLLFIMRVRLFSFIRIIRLRVQRNVRVRHILGGRFLLFIRFIWFFLSSRVIQNIWQIANLYLNLQIIFKKQ
jgi:hypothetical protein